MSNEKTLDISITDDFFAPVKKSTSCVMKGKSLDLVNLSKIIKRIEKLESEVELLKKQVTE